MIAKVTHGNRFGGLMVYLAGPGRANEHEDPHLVAGDPELMMMHGGHELDRDEALTVARALDTDRRATGVEVLSSRRRYDTEAADYVQGAKGESHVWQCSLSLHADEGSLSDEKWGAIAADFMARMGFDDPADPREPARWVAVRHGASSGGNDHVHLVASVVRPDGTKVAGYRDYRAVSQATHEIERTYGLRVIESRSQGFESNERAYSQSEDMAQRRQHNRRHGQAEMGGRDPERLVRHDVHTRVRACAASSGDEAEFVRRLRQHGLGVRPRFAKGSDEVVTGYSVRLAGGEGVDASRWFAAGQLAKDLSLPALREAHGWSADPHTASAAAAEWRAGSRGTRPAAPGRETRPPVEQDWRSWYARTGQLVEHLSATTDDPQVWAVAAREASGALAALSVRTEGPGGGPVGQAARALSRSAYTTRHRVTAAAPRGPASMPIQSLGDVAVLLAAAAPGHKRAHLDAALVAQVMRLAQGLHGIHAGAGRPREAERVRIAAREHLREVTRALPAVKSLVEYDKQLAVDAEREWVHIPIGDTGKSVRVRRPGTGTTPESPTEDERAAQAARLAQQQRQQQSNNQSQSRGPRR